jgi:hypothetical protein
MLASSALGTPGVCVYQWRDGSLVESAQLNCGADGATAVVLNCNNQASAVFHFLKAISPYRIPRLAITVSHLAILRFTHPIITLQVVASASASGGVSLQLPEPGRPPLYAFDVGGAARSLSFDPTSRYLACGAF